MCQLYAFTLIAWPVCNLEFLTSIDDDFDDYCDDDESDNGEDDEEDFDALPAPGETSQGTGTDVHKIDEEESTEGNEENDESFLFSDLAEQLGTLGED